MCPRVTLSKKTIALAVSSFSGGGAERIIVTLANYFYSRGYPVDLIIGADKGPYKDEVDRGIRKIVLCDMNQPWLIRRWSALKNLWLYLRQNNACVIMSTIREFNLFVGAIKHFSGSYLPHVMCEADTLDRITYSPSLKNQLLRKAMRMLYPNAATVLANSNATKSDLIEMIGLNREKVIVVYQPFDLEKIRSLSGPLEKRTQNPPKLIACGRLDAKKNFSDLIKVLPQLKQIYPDITLDILGQGPEEKTLKELVESLELDRAVNFEGFVSNPYKYFAKGNVFVQTSLWEGFGNVVVEAMACGTPVVLYDSKGAMREILDNGKYGSLTPVGDLHALAAAINRQIANPTPRSLLNEAVARYDINFIGRNILTRLQIE